MKKIADIYNIEKLQRTLQENIENERKIKNNAAKILQSAIRSFIERKRINKLNKELDNYEHIDNEYKKDSWSLFFWN